MAIRWHKLAADPYGAGYFAHIDIAPGVRADRVGSGEVARGAAIGADPAEEQVSLLIEYADMTGQVVSDLPVDPGLL
ncbi:MAG TPA: hypothetical protein VMX75_02170, partial [Spirochaetia bacterium]|nr:hypothetical protein [Spirochaetia bacterium]